MDTLELYENEKLLWKKDTINKGKRKMWSEEDTCTLYKKKLQFNKKKIVNLIEKDINSSQKRQYKWSVNMKRCFSLQVLRELQTIRKGDRM